MNTRGEQALGVIANAGRNRAFTKGITCTGLHVSARRKSAAAPGRSVGTHAVIKTIALCAHDMDPLTLIVVRELLPSGAAIFAVGA